MVRVSFTQNIQRHVACPSVEARGATVREVLDDVFARHAAVRSFVLDDQGGVRRHMIVFLNGRPIRDRERLTDAVPDGAELYVMQALSGG